MSTLHYSEKYGELLAPANDSIVPGLSLYELYKTSAHKQEDLVKKWVSSVRQDLVFGGSQGYTYVLGMPSDFW